MLSLDIASISFIFAKSGTVFLPHFSLNKANFEYLNLLRTLEVRVKTDLNLYPQRDPI